MKLKSRWKQADNWGLIKRTLGYFKDYKLLIGISFVALALYAAATAGTAFLVKPAVDEIFINKDHTALLYIPFLVVFLFALKGFCFYLKSYLLAYCGTKVMGSIRRELYTKITSMPLTFFDENRPGMLMSRINSDVSKLSASLPTMIEMGRHIVTMIGLLGVVFYRDAFLATLSLIIYPLAMYPFVYFAKRLRKVGRKTQVISADISNFLYETFGGIRVIKAFASEEKENQNFFHENKKMVDNALRVNRYSIASTPIMEFVGAIGIGLIIWYGGSQVIAGHSTPGTFFSFLAAIVLLYQPVKKLNKVNIEIQKALTGAERVFEVLDSKELPAETGGEIELKGPFESLELTNVTFTYPGCETPAVDDLSLVIRYGEKVAIVGPSGSGKTTLIHLLPRFYEHQQGQIKLNGVPTREYTLKSLRMFMGIVAQDNFLFNTSIKQNIAYALDDADQDKVIAAAKAAYAHDFIMDLPQGYDTVIGERGVKLSGGQKQRITIARALLKNPPLLILDEATSALDTESERIVQMALDNLMKDRTSIVIAHRLSTVLASDRIIVMSQARIAGQGTHDQLLVSCPLYRKLYDMQFKEESG